jgi:hypothetical protein
MPHRHASRKELARAFSQLVLARESIMVYAATALRQPELVETPGLASALGLWLAVLERAEKEGDTGVETLVAVVLADNPGADDLRAAFEIWQERSAAAEASEPPPSSDGRGDPAPSSKSASGQRISELSRWVVFILGVAVIVWKVVGP